MKQKIQKVDSGRFNLFPLLDKVAQHPELPRMGRENRMGSQWYQDAREKLLDDAKVPKQSGWYMWGNFNDAAWWQPLYIGLSLRSEKWRGVYDRLLDELYEENASIFATVYGRDATTTVSRDWLNEWHDKGSGKDWVKQGGGIQHALRKTNSTFVIWATVSEKITKKELGNVESALIRHYRTGFNVERPEHRKIIGIGDSPLAERVVHSMDRQIQEMRGKFRI